MRPYADALAEFLLACPTPMTVAIQGDWGSGKTSTIEMVWKRLEQSPHAVDIVVINTWQYAQLNLGDDLMFHLLDAIVDQVSEHNQGAALVAKRCLQALGSAGLAAVKIAAGTTAGAVGPMGAGAYEAMLSSMVATPSAVQNLETLHEKFVELIGKRVDQDGRPKRVVLFVDDLDRLPPVRAVEVMEVLKTLLECPGCVFVLAIDFSVVSQGVHKKYDGEMDPRKARAYFDKMIQLPFDMPVGSYQVADLLEESLQTLGIEVDDLRSYADLAQWSVGHNPRALKRLLNSFSLLRGIARATSTTDPPSAEVPDVGLFALLALQTAYPVYRNDLQLLTTAEVHRQLTDDQVLARDPESDDHDNLTRWEVDAGRSDLFADLLGAVATVLPPSEDASLTRILDLTSITSIRPGRAPKPPTTTTAAPLEERSASIGSTYGAPPDLVAHAVELEQAMGRHLTQRGLPFSATERATKPMWVWWVTDPGERPRGRFCEVAFAKDDSISLTFALGTWPDDVRAAVREQAKTMAGEHHWQYAEHPRGDYQRLLGIKPGSPVAPLVGLLADCYAQTRTPR